MIEQHYPEPIVGVLIVSPEGKVLLLKSEKWKNHYTVPGGHLELGEKLEDAVKREVKEETGLDVFDIEFLDTQEFIYGNTYHKKRHFIFLDFICKTKTTKVKLNEESDNYIWAYPEEAIKPPVEPYSIKFIEKFMKSRQK